MALSLNEFVEQRITPEMKKLGLQNLVEKLQEK